MLLSYLFVFIRPKLKLSPNVPAEQGGVSSYLVTVNY
jgi:hypothetical protein